MDPANQKSVVDLQNETALEREKTNSKVKGKQKATALSSDSDGADDDAMDVDDVNLSDTAAPDSERPMVPMAKPESIAALRDKLHMRMAALRRGGQGGGEPGDKDELLEERRKQRAALREKRRKETKERRKAETEGKKGKKDLVAKGLPIKVRFCNLRVFILIPSLCSRPTESTTCSGLDSDFEKSCGISQHRRSLDQCDFFCDRWKFKQKSRGAQDVFQSQPSSVATRCAEGKTRFDARG